MKKNAVAATPAGRPVLATSLIAGAVLALLAARQAHAADAPAPAASAASAPEVQEVIVTSERRSTSLQKTPASISVKSGESMSEAGQTVLGQMLEDVPGVSMNTQGVNTDSLGLSVVVRGVQPDVTAGGASSAAPTTAVYTDSIFSGIGGDYDIDRIEVLRGPQGTLYGRSATSGVVSILTNNPTLRHTGGDLLLEGGTASLKHASGDVNVALGGSAALRISANDLQHDGYYSADGGYTHTRGERAKLLWKPTDDVSVLLGAAHQEQVLHSGGDIFVATGPTSYTSSTGTVAGQKYTSSQYWAQLDWNLGFANLTYIPSFRNWDTSGDQIIGANIILQTNRYPHDRFQTHELRLTSNDAGPLKWLVGAFYYDNQYENQTSATWIASQALTWRQDVNKSTRNIGLFGESTYALTDATRLTAGLRLDTTKVDTWGYYTQNNAVPAAGTDPTSPTWFLPEVLSTATLTPDQGRLKFNNTTFKLRAEHDLTAANSVYATVASGFQPGDSQFTTTSAGAVAMPYEQERLMSYELGTKNKFLEGRLTVNADVFHYAYSGFQTTANTSGNPQNPSYAVLTAPARMSGGEVEARWRLGAADTISASYAYINAKYHGAGTDFQTYVVQDKIPGIAPSTATLGYDHVFEIGGGSLRAHADARYQDAYDLGAMTSTETADATWNRSKAATFLNANVTWDSPAGTYSVTGYVRNLSNEKVRTSFSFQDESITLSDPRTFGVVLQAHF